MEWQQKVMEQIILLAFADRFLSVIAIIGPLEKMAKQATVKDVAPAKFIAAYAAHLKKGGKITLPAWVDIVKTSSNNELAPSDSEWYYVRAAAVARKIYVKGGVGVGSMRRLFGRASRTGPTPVHTGSSSGAVIRSVLKNLEKLGLVEKDPNGYVERRYAAPKFNWKIHTSFFFKTVLTFPYSFFQHQQRTQNHLHWPTRLGSHCHQHCQQVNGRKI